MLIYIASDNASVGKGFVPLQKGEEYAYTASLGMVFALQQF